MSKLYEPCTLCRGSDDVEGFDHCPGCGGSGFIEIGLTSGQVNRLVDTNAALLATSLKLKEAAGRAIAVLMFEAEHAATRGDGVAIWQIADALNGLREAIGDAERKAVTP